MSPALLAPGHALFPTRDRWVVRTPDGAMAAIRADRAADIAGLFGGPPGPATAQLRVELRAAGILTDPGGPDSPDVPGAPTALTRVAVLLVGSDRWTTPLRDELTRRGIDDVATAPTGSAPALLDALLADPTRSDRISAVSWCAATPADLPGAVADELDRLCAEGRLRWQRTVLEGATAVVEPLGAGAWPVTHAMTRARRLAAADHPEALAGFWSDRARHGPDLLSKESAAALATLVADDLAPTLLGTVPGPATRRLRRVDLRTGRWTDHPILPVPRHDPPVPRG
ncbi:hypothetical protein [Nakamurella flava]|uniref:hypothetical protein n=1 Tax=Nakamurella flava TaxID=2576308 RepID=UPI00140BEB07|nr:hypothetical protein [Nakamurella flava]